MSKPFLLVAGSLVTIGALVPPLHDLAPVLFTAHMVQHLVLVLVAAPLIAAGIPRLPSLGAISVWILHAGALWAWHLPSAYDAAIRSDILHGIEHLSFLVTGVLFWAFVLRRSEVSSLERVGLVFATALQSSALGALLAFASRPLYASHIGRTSDWGMSALEDQQLAGAIMWVPPGVIYLAVMLVLLYRWFTQMDAGVVEAQATGGPR